ncbi:NAD(P)H-hydrate epimerase [Aspergillus udagawae]|uniref:NAD(P)H-hydrate epimerase n=1 Tax=Aspergillus udagawae TaxID=91492 RepID=A0A8H3S181_9EURO|nr:NAD(P)H-hydrate epimerase [Aspergillus udagawae]
MSLKAISAKDAASLDKDLMEMGGWSLDQLMELAGLSVSQAGILSPSSPKRWQECPRRLWPREQRTAIHPQSTIPKKGRMSCTRQATPGTAPNGPRLIISHQQRLKTQLQNLSVPFVPDFTEALKSADFLVDAIFGFSFGGPLRDPFPSIVSQIESSSVPVLSVDAPSSWDIQSGPPKEGPGSKFMPDALISLTAPKPCVKYYRGRHFVGGRFLTKSIVEKYGLDCPDYPGIDQIVEVGVDAEGRL